ncbi:hypothetical protein DFH09DRAFT_1086958 [Mycena vulgaris]|nr:hypothetical protein DFH09DRAFT_1086958 [Mycena vulgaris]
MYIRRRRPAPFVSINDIRRAQGGRLTSHIMREEEQSDRGRTQLDLAILLNRRRVSDEEDQLRRSDHEKGRRAEICATRGGGCGRPGGRMQERGNQVERMTDGEARRGKVDLRTNSEYGKYNYRRVSDEGSGEATLAMAVRRGNTRHGVNGRTTRREGIVLECVSAGRRESRPRGDLRRRTYMDWLEDEAKENGGRKGETVRANGEELEESATAKERRDRPATGWNRARAGEARAANPTPTRLKTPARTGLTPVSFSHWGLLRCGGALGVFRAINLMTRVKAGRARTHKYNNTDASRLNGKHVRDTGDYINTTLRKTGKGQITLALSGMEEGLKRFDGKPNKPGARRTRELALKSLIKQN